MRVTRTELENITQLMSALEDETYWPYSIAGELNLTNKDNDYIGSIWPHGDDWVYGTTDD